MIEWILENFGYVFCALAFATALGSLVAYLIELGDASWE